jgi:hypothetical protein
MGRDHRPHSSKACVSLLRLILLTPLPMPIINQVLRMKAASLPTEFLQPQLPQSKTTRPNFLDHRTPTIIIIDRMCLLPPTLHDQVAFPGPVCRVRALRPLTIAQQHPPERSRHSNAHEPYLSPNLWSLTSPPLHALMCQRHCPMVPVPPMSSRHVSLYRARARRAVLDKYKPRARRVLKVVTADIAHITIYIQATPSALLRSSSNSNDIPECADLPSTAQRRVRLLTLKKGLSNIGIGVRYREMAALANFALGDIRKCWRLPITDIRRLVQRTIGGMAAQVYGGVQAVPMCACVRASTWRLTANTRECSMRLLRRTWRMVWSLKAILNVGRPRVPRRMLRIRAQRLPSLRTSILALGLPLIAERMLQGLAAVAVALVRGVRRVLHSLPGFRRHHRLANFPTPRGRRLLPKRHPRPPQNPSHQRRAPASPVEIIRHLRRPQGCPRSRHRRPRSVRRALPRWLSHHQRKSLDPARLL